MAAASSVSTAVPSLEELQQQLGHLRTKVADLNDSIDKQLATDKGMPYLQVKNHLLLNYSKLELFFTMLKLQTPDQVRDHPVFEQLVRDRVFLERMRPLDRKLKYQVDKMLKVALSDGNSLEEALVYAPHPEQLESATGGATSAGASEENGSKADRHGNDAEESDVYRAPRLAAVFYEEEERKQAKEAKQQKKQRERLQKSTVLSELREEFSERPMEVLGGNSTSALDKELAKEEAEKRAYEEERFVRLVTSRKDKIRKRQRERDAMQADDLGSIDNFARVQDILNKTQGAGGDSKNKAKYLPKESRKARIGGKTGGIFAHVDVEKSSTKKPRYASSASAPSSDSASSSRQPVASAPAKESAPTAGGKKKKVVFSNLFD